VPQGLGRDSGRKGAAPGPGDLRGRPNAGANGRIALFVDTWNNYFTPQVSIAAVQVLEALGYEVIVPETTCCGRPAISKGILGLAAELARANEAALGPVAAAGIPIVGIEPSCILTFVDEFPQLVRTDAARQIAARVQTIEGFLAGHLAELGALVEGRRAAGEAPSPVLLHAHCHQKAITGTGAAMALLRVVDGGAREINSGCCGMAGSFGHEREHYEVAKAIGEQRLFPAIRAAPESRVCVTGFSCRHQIEHHTGRRPLHVVEWIADETSKIQNVKESKPGTGR
jgi:Fe-S oxidoreductase